MQRLGYDRFVAQGGDWGAPSRNSWRLLAPDHVMAIHSNMPGHRSRRHLGEAKSGANAPPPAGSRATS
jgi:hypothetical protein